MINDRQYYDNTSTRNRTSRSTSSRSSSSTSTTTTVATEPGVSSSRATVDYAWNQIIAAYCRTINQNMSMQVAHMIADYMRWGIESDVIIEAINETGFAPKPSPQYLRAILRRCTNQGIMTMEQWNYAQDERQTAIHTACNARFDAWSYYPGKEEDLPF